MTRIVPFVAAGLIVVTPALSIVTPALARQPEKMITKREPSAIDVATTPANDLNIRKGQIPPILIEAQQRPYDLAGLGRCANLADKIAEFDAVLGDDIDLPQDSGRRISPGRIAQSLIGSFIPFRGIVREVSGANAQQRSLEAAVDAGIARRSFLKGVGQARGCRYPARSATPAVLAQLSKGAEPGVVEAEQTKATPEATSAAAD